MDIQPQIYPGPRYVALLRKQDSRSFVAKLITLALSVAFYTNLTNTISTIIPRVPNVDLGSRIYFYIRALIYNREKY